MRKEKDEARLSSNPLETPQGPEDRRPIPKLGMRGDEPTLEGQIRRSGEDFMKKLMRGTAITNLGVATSAVHNQCVENDRRRRKGDPEAKNMNYLTSSVFMPDGADVVYRRHGEGAIGMVIDPAEKE